ncbi:MAG TPA: cation:proton antiporter [Chloroflexia bacterium]|nr:cation:proton antiporter [Chloroflexia bacterium]
MQLTGEELAGVLALVGMVIVVAALLSGLIERSNFPQVAVFLGLGAVLGPAGLGMIDIGLDSPMLRIVATLSLALVLFTDAVGLNLTETRRHAKLAFLVLGPGTMLTGVIVTLMGWWMLGLPLAAAAIVGAALVSTDPVLLRGLLKSRDLPAAARQALRLESGLNDAVLLPVVLVALTFLGAGAEGASGSPDWTRLVIDQFLLGPGAGIAVALLAVATLDLIRRKIGVRRDYESLYSLGVAFAAFAVAESVHGSGFLAAFAAGLTISALDVELCDCFLEYGETTAEMALLFTFVLFGASLIWEGLAILTPLTLLFALLVIVARVAAFVPALAFTRLTRKEKLLISWFGPRGLSTLLLVLLAVFADAPGAETMFAICSLVVLVSVVLHGGSMMFLGRISGRKARRAGTPPLSPGEPPAAPIAPAAVAVAEPEVEVAPVPDGRAHEHEVAAPTPVAEDVEADGAQATAERMTIAEMRMLQERGERVILVDARTERTFGNSDRAAVGAVRIDPNAGMVAEQAAEQGIPKDAWLAIFCA